MKKAKTVGNKEEELEARSEGDYENAMEEYSAKKGAVDSAVDMIGQPFWREGFKSRRELFDKTRTKLAEVVEESPPEDYDSVEDLKALNKSKLDFTKAMADFDNYVGDVQNAVNVLADSVRGGVRAVNVGVLCGLRGGAGARFFLACVVGRG